MIPEFLLFFIGIFPVIRTLKSSYKFVRIFPLFYRTFSFFYRTFSTQKKAKIYFPFCRSFSPSSLFSLQRVYLHFSTYLHTTCVKGEIIQIFIIMHNYETMLVIILGNLNIYVVSWRNLKIILLQAGFELAPSWSVG